MLTLFLEWLGAGDIGVGARALFAALTACLVSLFAGPFCIRMLRAMKASQPIRKEEEFPKGFLLGELHKGKKDTPTMGGLLILCSVLIAVFVWADLRSMFCLLLTLTMLFFGALGGYDDYLKLRFKNFRGLSARKKLLFQLLWAGVITAYLTVPGVAESLQCGNFFVPPPSLQEYSRELYLPFIKQAVWVSSGSIPWLLFLFFAFVILGAANSVNLTDGLDGLAGGSVAVVATTLALFVICAPCPVAASSFRHDLALAGIGEVGVFLAAISGACLGFLWYNRHPAKLFMGDVGSLALGGVLGVSAIFLREEFLLGLVGAVFVAEALSVIAQVICFRLTGKRVLLCSPLHHHFEYKGVAETKIVSYFWMVTVVLCLAGLMTLL